MATRTLRGPLPEYGYTAASAGCRRGVVLVQGANNRLAVVAAAIGQGKYRGIQIDEGTLPDGSANYGQDAQHPAEQVNAQKEGIAWGLAPANTTPAQGDQAWSDATGKLITRVPFSFSGFILGQFDEARTVGVNPELVGVELSPQYIEICRNLGGFAAAAPAAGATKWGALGAVAVQNAQSPLYVAGYAGETVRNLKVSVGTAPGVGETLAFTVQKSSDNGATWVDTALTCTIAGTSKAASDLAHAVALAAGDLLALKMVASNNGAYAAAAVAFCFDVT